MITVIAFSVFLCTLSLGATVILYAAMAINNKTVMSTTKKGR